MCYQQNLKRRGIYWINLLKLQKDLKIDQPRLNLHQKCIKILIQKKKSKIITFQLKIFHQKINLRKEERKRQTYLPEILKSNLFHKLQKVVLKKSSFLPFKKIEKSPVSDYPLSKNVSKTGVLPEKIEPQILSPSPLSRLQVPIQEKDKNSTSVALSDLQNPQANVSSRNSKPEVKKIHLRETFKMDSLVIPPRKVAAKASLPTQNIEDNKHESPQMEKKEEDKELMKSTLMHQPGEVAIGDTKSPVHDRVQQIAQPTPSLNELPHEKAKNNEQLAENKLQQVPIQKPKKEILQEIPKRHIEKEAQATVQEIPVRSIEKEQLNQVPKESKIALQEIPQRVNKKGSTMIIQELSLIHI
eukprot:TRINITY_DN10512_c0_g1_i2.p1 TRINITY_DN10512_c0_g1~~TRINITY_DN10512_c0_g1_i2.p1  ORF type:complete len:357 (-),score=61.69 TRINITY_DN10512_c0_g1_i2:161-1231(-)